MLGRLVAWSLRRRLIVLLATMVILAWGVDSYRKLPIDAFPDVAPVQVLVAMQAPGLTPEELESRGHRAGRGRHAGHPQPGRHALASRATRVALITFEFADGTDIYWARAQVDERLQDAARPCCRMAPMAGLAPIVTPLGEMLMFTHRVGDAVARSRCRSLIDWTIRPALRGLPGVADVNVLGGFVRTFEVAPDRRGHGRARHHHADAGGGAVTANNRNDGAGRVRDGEEALLVRSEGRIRTLDDIRAHRRRGAPDRRGPRRRCRRCALRRAAAQRRGHHERRGRGGLGHRCSACAAPTPRRSSTASSTSWRRSKDPAGRREDRDLLRPQRADREGGLDRAGGADRGDRAGRDPADAVPRQSARGAGGVAHPAAGGAVTFVVMRLVGYLGQHHVARRPGDRDRPAGRLRRRGRRERRASPMRMAGKADLQHRGCA